MMLDALPPIITQKEAAELLRVSTQTVARLRAGGVLPYLPGRPVRIKLIDLLEYIDKCSTRVCVYPSPGSGKSAIQKKMRTRADTAAKAYHAGRLTGLRRKLS